MKITRFEDLEIWKLARELVKKVYRLSGKGDMAKDFKFRDQWRDSTRSIMDNPAEGFERGGNKEFSHFLSIAKGSAGESRSQSYSAFDLNYINQEEFDDVFQDLVVVSGKISHLMEYLRESDIKGIKFKRD